MHDKGMDDILVANNLSCTCQLIYSMKDYIFNKEQLMCLVGDPKIVILNSDSSANGKDRFGGLNRKIKAVLFAHMRSSVCRVVTDHMCVYIPSIHKTAPRASVLLSFVLI